MTDAKALDLIRRMESEDVPPTPGHADFASEWAVLLSCYQGHEVTALYTPGEAPVLDNLLESFKAFNQDETFPIWLWRFTLGYAVLIELRQAIRAVANQWTSAAQAPGNTLTAEQRAELEDPDSPLV